MTVSSVGGGQVPILNYESKVVKPITLIYYKVDDVNEAIKQINSQLVNSLWFDIDWLELIRTNKVPFAITEALIRSHAATVGKSFFDIVCDTLNPDSTSFKLLDNKEIINGLMWVACVNGFRANQLLEKLETSHHVLKNECASEIRTIKDYILGVISKQYQEVIVYLNVRLEACDALVLNKEVISKAKGDLNRALYTDDGKVILSDDKLLLENSSEFDRVCSTLYQQKRFPILLTMLSLNNAVKISKSHIPNSLESTLFTFLLSLETCKVEANAKALACVDNILRWLWLADTPYVTQLYYAIQLKENTEPNDPILSFLGKGTIRGLLRERMRKLKENPAIKEFKWDASADKKTLTLATQKAPLDHERLYLKPEVYQEVIIENWALIMKRLNLSSEVKLLLITKGVLTKLESDRADKHEKEGSAGWNNFLKRHFEANPKCCKGFIDVLKMSSLGNEGLAAELIHALETKKVN